MGQRVFLSFPRAVMYHMPYHEVILFVVLLVCMYYELRNDLMNEFMSRDVVLFTLSLHLKNDYQRTSSPASPKNEPQNEGKCLFFDVSSHLCKRLCPSVCPLGFQINRRKWRLKPDELLFAYAYCMRKRISVRCQNIFVGVEYRGLYGGECK